MKVCEVDIFGDTYALRADMDETFVRNLARLVDSRMREVSEASPSASSLQVAVLAALDLASESMSTDKKSEGDEKIALELSAEVSERADRMLKRIFEAVPEFQP